MNAAKLSSRVLVVFTALVTSFSLQAETTHKAPEGPKKHRYEADPAPLRTMEYNYRYALENPQNDRLKVKFKVTDLDLSKTPGDLYVHCNYVDIKHDQKQKSASIWVDGPENKNFTFELPDLKPESVYKLNCSLNVTTKTVPKKNTQLRSLGEYWGVTSGDSKVAKARFGFVTTLLLEHNDWNVGRTDAHRAPYALELPYNWCGVYPHWCGKPYLKVFDEEPSDSYGKWGKYLDGSALSGIAKKEPVHGNYAQWTNNGLYHKMTILGVSEDTNMVYTIEGNYGGWMGRTGIVQRNLNEIGRLGVITEGMLWEK